VASLVDTLVAKVTSLCPQCKKPIESSIIERDGGIYQISTCSLHGTTESRIFSNADLYKKLDEWNDLVFPPSQADISGKNIEDLNLWTKSVHSPTLGIIDLTNCCNYSCPLCFAGEENRSHFYFLSLDTVRKMLEVLLSQSPAPCRSVQFSGGEPTLHPEFPAILQIARDMGFSHIQVATNGSRFIDKDFVSLCEHSGLHTLYLQFDGLNDDVYLKLRGRRLLDTKMAIVENVAGSNMRIVLVPTVATSINVDQLGPIFQFALKYSKHVSGISVQPASYVGRTQIPADGGTPFNLADMAIEFGKQTGLTKFPDDWFPLNAISKITLGIERLRGEALPLAACDAHCSLGTYFYIDEKDNPFCLNHFMDLDRFFKRIGSLSPKGEKGFLRERICRLMELRSLADCFNERKAPDGLTFNRLLRGLDGWEDKSWGRRDDWFRKGFNGLFVAGMHFMDSGNYNLRRLRRCIIHYVTADGDLIPFCSYNAGLRCRNAEEMKRKASARKSREPLESESCLNSKR
jgi:uncharacterized radical SAM superfamily Fe-S cluster-containing enzyme